MSHLSLELVRVKPYTISVRWMREIGVTRRDDIYRAIRDELETIPGVEEVVVQRYSAEVTYAPHIASEREIFIAVAEMFSFDDLATDIARAMLDDQLEQVRILLPAYELTAPRDQEIIYVRDADFLV